MRLQLGGEIISKIIRIFLQEKLRLKFDELFHIIHSEIIQTMINKESYGFNTFTVNRLGKIHQSTLPSEWYWVKGNVNIAHWISRGMSVSDLKVAEGPSGQFIQKLNQNMYLKN